jgi:hypothetical protein
MRLAVEAAEYDLLSAHSRPEIEVLGKKAAGNRTRER